MQKAPLLILMRHGQSDWNKRNLFTGWVDIPLSMEGIQEALEGGRQIADIPIDVIFVSSLCRAQMTATVAMSVHKGGKVPLFSHPLEKEKKDWGKIYNPAAESSCIPVFEAWQLNERMYGQLQGLNKQETIDKYGAEQVKIWRRSYDVAPPGGESLEMTAARSIPYFAEKVAPYCKQGKNVFISAHGNSLRSIVMYLEGLTKQQVLEFEIPTGQPLIYQYQDGKWSRRS